jgi:flagellar hook-length control protein FliK
METQPTQHGLMQIFTSLGLATDNSLTALEGQNPDGKGFASLLSGYLPSDADNSAASLNSNLLPPAIIANPDAGPLSFAALAEGELPLLGQALPLEAVGPLITPSNVLSAEEASIVASNRRNHESINAASVENDASTQALENQGFYAQSLVSSLIGNSSAINSGVSAVLNNTATIAGETAKFAHVIPQQISNGINLQNLTASELDAMSDEAGDRFLGSEPVLNSLKPKKSAAVELFSAAPAIAALNTPVALESSVSLALALNEDPTTQSLDELIDGETLKQGELETKLNTLERKQDDQTLKLSKGQQAWGDAITERITMNAAKDIKQVTIHLDPPELGSLELKLQIKEDQQTHVQVQVQNPQVKEALESSAHRLREMLASQGLELAEFDVQADAGRGEQAAYDSDQQGQGQSQNSDTPQDLGEEISVEIPKAKNNNLLDTFV